MQRLQGALGHYITKLGEQLYRALATTGSKASASGCAVVAVETRDSHRRRKATTRTIWMSKYYSTEHRVGS